MKWAIILALVAGGGFLAWKQMQKSPSVEQVESPTAGDPNQTAGTDLVNRVDTRSGTVDPDAR